MSIREILNAIASKTVLEAQREGWAIVPKTVGEGTITYTAEKRYGSFAVRIVEWGIHRKVYAIVKINGEWYYYHR